VNRWQTTDEAAQAQLIQAREQAEQTTREAADSTARIVSQAAIWSFFALVLGALVAAIGGYLDSTSNLKFTFPINRSGAQQGRSILHS